MKKKLIFGLIFLLVAFGFLEAQYHFFLRANRYWSNAGVFSTDGMIQSIGTDNKIRVAYSGSRYAEFICASDGTADLSNIGQITFKERGIENRGTATYMFADGLAVGNEGIPSDAQGVRLYFDWGSTPTLSGDGRMVHGLDITMNMDQDWSFTSAKRNAVIRGARIQGHSTNNVGGKVMGAYINARANGPGEFEIEGIISGAIDGAGMVSIEARTEIGTDTEITTPAVAGVMCYHRGMTGSNLIGDYMGVYLQQPYYVSQTGTTYGVWFANDGGTGDPYDFALGFSSELDANVVAHYAATLGASLTDTDVDGWIRVEIDGQDLYIYCFNTKP